MDGVSFGGNVKHTGVGLTEHGLIKAFAETLGSLGHLLIHLLVHLGQMILDKHIGTIAFLGVLVVNQGIVEGINMTRRLPDGRMHEDGRVYTDDILMKERHGVPPIPLDIVFKFHTVLAVVIDCGKSVINLAGLKHEAILFGVAYNLLENIFLGCHRFWFMG